MPCMYIIDVQKQKNDGVWRMITYTFFEQNISKTSAVGSPGWMVNAPLFQAASCAIRTRQVHNWSKCVSCKFDRMSRRHVVCAEAASNLSLPNQQRKNTRKRDKSYVILLLYISFCYLPFISMLDDARGQHQHIVMPLSLLEPQSRLGGTLLGIRV